MLGAIQGARAEVTPGSDDSNVEIMRSLWRMTAKEKQLFIQDRLLEQLSFQDQPEREHRIAEAHAKTFRWIWTDPTGQPDKPWSHFVAWLEGDDDRLYWMTGKAGSGKSTMMKYVVHQQQCEESLRRWSGKMPLIVTRFYLWNSGSQDQMSQEGLIRAILYDSVSLNIPSLSPRSSQNDGNAVSYLGLIYAIGIPSNLKRPSNLWQKLQMAALSFVSLWMDLTSLMASTIY